MTVQDIYISAGQAGLPGAAFVPHSAWRLRSSAASASSQAGVRGSTAVTASKAPTGAAGWPCVPRERLQ